MKKGKVIIFSAPSGSGKSTIINTIKERNKFPFVFSVSATNRPPRGNEQYGVDYYFLSDEEFRKRLNNEEFLESCEVYPGRFYGTLKEEIISRIERGENVIVDVDVDGGLKIKDFFGSDAIGIFIMPPSVEELRRRLEKRGTDSQDKIEQRLNRAKYEMDQSSRYDKIVNNDVIENAVKDCENIILHHLSSH